MVQRWEKGQGEQEEGTGSNRGKGRLLQERDRLALWLAATHRVLRERTLIAAVFPGRDASTAKNRVAELARELDPVGAYWRVYRRTLEDGSVERYLGVTDVGYRQGSHLVGRSWFERQPTDPLRPSHIAHDLELADFCVSLLPTKREQHQPMVRGRPVGSPVQVEVPCVPTRWRCRHASICRSLTVFEGRKDPTGRWQGRPQIACAYEPDAIIETNAGNCTRYFLEWDRGTEPVTGRETRTIQDKFKRILAYFWTPHRLDPGPHWSERGSYYLSAFPGAEMRVPKVLLITRSRDRAKNITRLADKMFERWGAGARALVEVLTVPEASSRLLNALEFSERCEPPDEMPWVEERRFREVAAARARAVANRKKRIERLRDPLLVPYEAHRHGELTPNCVLSVTDARSLVAWFDRDRDGQEMRWTAISSAAKPLDELREATRVGLGTRVASALGFVPAAPDSVSIEFGDTRAVVRLASEVMRKRAQLGGSAGHSGERELLRVLGRLLVHARVDPELIPELVVACRAGWDDDDPESPWASVIAGLKSGIAVAPGR